MTRLNESPQDRVYAECALLGPVEVEKKIDDNYFNGRDVGYAKSWLNENQNSKEALDIAREANKIAISNRNIAWIALGVSFFSVIISVLA